MPNSPATISIWTTFAPLTLRERNTPQRHQRVARAGLADDERNRAARPTAAPKASVSRAPQPRSPASTIV